MANQFQDIFESQRLCSLRLRGSKASVRKEKLRKLKQIILANEPDIYQALADDLGKPVFEAALTEVYFTYAEIDFALKNLGKWMKPKRVQATLSSLSTRNRIVYEPKE